jgi:CRISPR-associated protein Cst2
LASRKLPVNRTRLHGENHPAVEFKDYPNADEYADDFLFGYLVLDGKEMKKKERPAKRDSVLRMNMAVALSPYRFDATFHQSPLNAGKSPWKNAAKSFLFHREVSHTAYQYPFAINFNDCVSKPHWGQARSLFEMAPRSLVARLTPSLVAGFDTYGFDAAGSFSELRRIQKTDLPGNEFVVAGALARELPMEERARLDAEGVRFFDNPQAALRQLGADGLRA